ncbi:conjugal transfer protein TrbJ [Cupriavidus pauculus]|uniref:conjugal transfer protein TrbJ n=1 Tax=Cupriavidus pauculus TaxID=82633 RepID=UPI001EE18DEE|nr:conjugal transfer protein TrbJ [Cupriavidus pauculus]GJG97765.1 conjugal transfer protein TrbJ [Cupriavidus pauculus]
MKRTLLCLISAATWCTASYTPNAHAALAVTDWVSLVQTTTTALQSLKAEVYENTNIVYQYKMMADQLLQSTGLDVEAITEQLNAVRDEVRQYEAYGESLRDLYGAVSDSSDYLNRVQSMAVAMGKDTQQWFADQRSLLQNGDKSAKNIFRLATQIQSNTEALSQRRQKIQSQLKLTPTALSAAQTTNQMLEVLASQNADMLQLMSAKARSDSDRDGQDVAREAERAKSEEAIRKAQDDELRLLRSRVLSQPLRQSH